MKKAIIDIDGVLNYYPDTLISFYNDKYNTHYKTLKDIKSTISYSEYIKNKDEYRQSKYKYDCKPRKYSKELTHKLHENGFLIYIVTSRQLFTMNQLERTICWLKKNEIEYDYIYCSIKKDFTIFEKFGHVDLVLEDNVLNLSKIANINGDAIYINLINEDNYNYDCNFYRTSNLDDVIDIMEESKWLK